MTRTRIVITLFLVATAAMLLGLMASTFVTRRLAPAPTPPSEAVEPHRPAGNAAANV